MHCFPNSFTMFIAIWSCFVLVLLNFMQPSQIPDSELIEDSFRGFTRVDLGPWEAAYPYQKLKTVSERTLLW